MKITFISPGNSLEIYQNLSGVYSAIEPPTWALLLAESCRSVGHHVNIIDVNAENLSSVDVINRIKTSPPDLICLVVYGQNVNAGTVSMSGASKLANYIKTEGINIPIACIGSYVQSLPYKALNDEPNIDIIFTNEGVYALRNLLSKNRIDMNDLDDVKGIGFRKNGNPFLTSPEKIVPQERMDVDLPGYAWDLLPYKNKPFDLYRSPMWHACYDENKRTPYATLYTSLGCKFACEFCMINIINRSDNDPIGVAGNYSHMRFWSPEFIIKQFDKLNELGVKTIRICDEMFLLNQKYYVPICRLLADRSYSKDLLMWTYSRIDTVVKNPEILNLLKNSGIKWLCLGIESGDKNIRMEVSKGKFDNIDIKNVIKMIHDAGIEVLANYIFGLPDDTLETMQKTLELSKELCTSGWNGYGAMALPGSKLYKDALNSGLEIPKNYIDYSFHSYTTAPLSTKYLTSKEILKFRDDAFTEYHCHPNFLHRIEMLFGKTAVSNIKKMSSIKLSRNLLSV